MTQLEPLQLASRTPAEATRRVREASGTTAPLPNFLQFSRNAPTSPSGPGASPAASTARHLKLSHSTVSSELSCPQLSLAFSVEAMVLRTPSAWQPWCSTHLQRGGHGAPHAL